jgi:hypothetical protein
MLRLDKHERRKRGEIGLIIGLLMQAAAIVGIAAVGVHALWTWAVR